MTEPLDKVSQLVKRCMLTFPGIFPTRKHVLFHAFVTGGGFYWAKQKNGKIGLDYDDQEIPLRDQIPAFVDENPDWKDKRSDEERAQIEVEWAQMHRDFVNKHIDTLCKPYFSYGERDEIERFIVRPDSVNSYAPMADALQGLDRDQIDEDWLAAMIETAEHLGYRARCAADNRYEHMIEFVGKVLKKFRDPKKEAFIRRLIDEVRAES